LLCVPLRKTLIALATTAVLAGCGDSTPSDTSADAAIKAQIERQSTRHHARDLRRADAVMGYYEDTKLYDRYGIKNVKVRGGHVTVYTGIYPDKGDEHYLTGACMSLVDVFKWMRYLTVYTQGRYTSMTWNKGDLVCR
jgi:osmotically-inducible protein OsmY